MGILLSVFGVGLLAEASRDNDGTRRPLQNGASRRRPHTLALLRKRVAALQHSWRHHSMAILGSSAPLRRHRSAQGCGELILYSVGAGSCQFSSAVPFRGYDKMKK